MFLSPRFMHLLCSPASEGDNPNSDFTWDTGKLIITDEDNVLKQSFDIHVLNILKRRHKD